MASSTLPKIYLQAHELMIQAFSYDQRGHFSDARDSYMQATRLFAPLLKRLPQTAFADMWVQEARLCLSRAKQISLLQAKGKNPHLNGVSGKPDSELQQEELKASLRRCRVIPNPNLSWSDIFGLDQVVKEIQDLVILPLQHPELLEGRLKAPRALLLFGSPGCGKTQLLRVLASVVRPWNVSVFSVSAAHLLSKWLGESQKRIRALFEVSWEAAPSIIFIDEFDGMFSSPSQKTGRFQKPLSSTASMTAIQMQTELMQYMDGIPTPAVNQTVFIAAINFPWHIQHAQRRRFDRRLYVHPPNSKVILKLLTYLLQEVDHSLTANDLHRLSLNFKGYTPDEIKKVCEVTRLRAYDTASTPRSLEYSDFNEGLLIVPPMLLKLKRGEGVGTLRFRDFNAKFGSPRIKYPLESWEKLDYDPSDDIELKMTGVASEIKYRESLRNDNTIS